MKSTIVASVAVLIIALPSFADDPPAWQLNIPIKARTLVLDPRTGDRQEVFEELDLTGLHSPDGTRTAFIGSDPERVKAGHDFDLFVADLDPDEPSGKRNIRRVTTDQIRPTHQVWLPSSQGIAFLAHRSIDDASQVVWVVDLSTSPPAAPARLSDAAAENVWNLSVTPQGEVAFIQLNGRKNKQMHADLIVRRPFPQQKDSAIAVRKLIEDQHISSFAISPDGTTLAWSGLGSMFLVDLATGNSREIPLHGIHRQLINHSVNEFAWRPDGKVIAIRCHFLGGIARSFNADPNEPSPRMFAEDKIFFVPAGWTPTPESLVVGEGADFPSPMIDDSKSDTPPPAGDESKPWWIREIESPTLPMRWRAN